MPWGLVSYTAPGVLVGAQIGVCILRRTGGCDRRATVVLFIALAALMAVQSATNFGAVDVQ